MSAIAPANPRTGAGVWLDRLGLPTLDQPGSRVFLLALLIQSIGNGLFFSLILIYFNKVIELPLSRVGLALTVASGIGLAVNIVAGQVVDRAGAKKMVILSQAIQAVGYATYLLVGSVSGVLVVVMITTIGERIFWVAFPTVVTAIAPGSAKDRWFAVILSIRNAGLGIGGLLGAAVISIAGNSGYRMLLVANVVAFAIAAMLLTFLVPPIVTRMSGAQHGGYRQVMRDRLAMTVAGANIAFAYCAMIIYFGLPVFVVDSLGLPQQTVGLLFGLNAIQLAIGQTPAIRAVQGWRKTRILAAAGVVWIISSALFGFSLALPRGILVPYLILVVMLYTFGELIHAPTSTGLIAGLAPAELRGRYMAVLALSWGIAQTIGPGLFTNLLAWHDLAPWIVTMFFAAGGAALVLTAERGERGSESTT